MANTALREKRLGAHLSQEDLARRIREVGFELGDPNSCTKGIVKRWESGRTRRPQPRYLLALEHVFGEPAANLGFDADASYGLDRAQAIAENGLDSVFPLPEPAESYGGRSGIYLSEYGYESTGRGMQASRHHVIVLERGSRLMVRSVPQSASRVSMDLSVNGRVVTGTWAEQTQVDGYYRGSIYTGAIQMLEDDQPGPRRFAGKWVGFGKDGDTNVGPWSITMVAAELTPEAVDQWSREPE